LTYQITININTMTRTATSFQQLEITSHAGFSTERRVTANTVAKLVIDGFGTITNQAFINKLVENGRLPVTALKTKHIMLTSEYATQLLSKNADLFPNQF